VRLWVGITDDRWYHFLSGRPDLDEVNFWQPSGSQSFRALTPGEPFLFKLHSPNNFIVGGGYFARFSLLPLSFAWETFGPKNGAATLAEMRQRIGRYRKDALTETADTTIGNIVLVQPFFLHRNDWIPIPDDFKRGIQKGKTYRLDSSPGRELWEEARVRSDIGLPPTAENFAFVDEPRVMPGSAMYGEARLMRPRLGQGAFRVSITEVYGRRCAITGEKALPTLEAAHIRPVAEHGEHRIDNGLLLRSDVHRLFDSGYVTVAPDFRFRVSQRLKKDFDNGEPYYPLEGLSIRLPQAAEDRPLREFLEWHSDVRFKG